MYVKKNDRFLKFLNLPPVPAPVRPDVTGTGTRKPDAGIGRGRCRGHIAGAKDKVSAAGTP
ncbi:unnamed protein product [Staurois parvus]|uniref:Uncharacterized protein n=1 Tax=Staurois parvus TaxID=386267 RepID=A0ABN9BL58_9NEOB|nr:unnamed protein product [Staurois parvus]